MPRIAKRPVSVLVACKNEEDNLKNLLPKLLAQTYDKFEIVLVDDASIDNTLSVMKAFAEKNDHVQFISLPKTNNYAGNKKIAITKAIQKASFEHLLLTDADCEPSSKYWIQHMVSQFSEEEQLILGYGSYKKTTGWLNKLIRYETLLTAWQYFSYALVGLPYMGVGRNLAYTQSLFINARGFQDHQHIKSGDDDLFINQMATKNNTAICWEPEAHTLSEPKKTLTEWIRQKRRHITTAGAYKPIHQILLGLFYLSQFLFYFLAIFLFIVGFSTEIVILFMSIRFLFYFVGFIPTALKLDEKSIIFWAPILEFLLIVSQMCIFINNLVQKPSKW